MESCHGDIFGGHIIIILVVLLIDLSESTVFEFGSQSLDHGIFLDHVVFTRFQMAFKCGILPSYLTLGCS
jgi:hypothetical protein